MWEQKHCCKESLGDCCWGLRKLHKSVLGQKMIEKAHPERTLHKRHDSLFTPVPFLYPHTFLFLPLVSLVYVFTHTYVLIHTHMHIHTAAKMLIRASGCWLLLFIQTSLENKVKMSGSRIEQMDSAYVSVSFISKARTHTPFLFYPPCSTYY